MAFSFSLFRSDQCLKSLHTEGELAVTGHDGAVRWSTVAVSPGEVNGGVVVIFGMETGGVAMGEGAEKGVGEQAGNLSLGQSNGCSVSPLEQRDALKTQRVSHGSLGRSWWRRQACLPSSRHWAASKPRLRSSGRARSG